VDEVLDDLGDVIVIGGDCFWRCCLYFEVVVEVVC